MTNYRISHSLQENKIFIRPIKGNNLDRKIQIFSPSTEFPFLFAGSFTLGEDYDIWIAPGTQPGILDWKDGGCIVRIINENEIEEEIVINPAEEKTRVLFVSPHLSTGGCPQYLLKKIETYKNVLDIYVVEFQFQGADFVVQRNKIIENIGSEKFFSLGEDKKQLKDIIDRVNPEILHFEEMPESYVDMEMLDEIYNPSRKYFITETTHSSESSPATKRFLPDKFIFCSRYSQERFKELSVPSEVWEYPIEDMKRPNRFSALRKLGLDPDWIHVLNVGLFTPGKNQGEIFEIARKFLNEKVMFHFVGNQAGNFEHYWKPLMENKPANCKIWGERNDVSNFLSACDIFYFSSVFELNPLVVKEALSWKMPVLMYNLETYMGAYSNKNEITFLDPQKNLKNNEKILRKRIDEARNKIEIRTWLNRTKIVHIVSQIGTDVENKSIESVSKLADFCSDIEYTIHYNPPAKTIPKDKPPMFENDNLKPGHFGCFEAFRKSIAEDFTDDYEFLIVCERDCFVEKTPEEIVALLKQTYKVMEDENITYFSFGDKVDLDNCYTQSERVGDIPGDFAYVTNKIIGLQFIIFNIKGRNFLREQFKSNNWYGMDIWLNEVYNNNNMKMGILNDRVTTQLDGYSLIDETEKTFKANKK